MFYISYKSTSSLFCNNMPIQTIWWIQGMYWKGIGVDKDNVCNQYILGGIIPLKFRRFFTSKLTFSDNDSMVKEITITFSFQMVFGYNLLQTREYNNLRDDVSTIDIIWQLM